MTEEKQAIKEKPVEKEKPTEKKELPKETTTEVKEKPTEKKEAPKKETKKVVDDPTATAKMVNIQISSKFAREICGHLRGKNLQSSKIILQDAINLKRAIPFKRYNRDLGHKPGMAAGRFPVNACKETLKLLNSVEANAENKGLNKDKLIIEEIKANQGVHQMHHGRLRSRKFKRTHLDIKVREVEQ